MSRLWGEQGEGSKALDDLDRTLLRNGTPQPQKLQLAPMSTMYNFAPEGGVGNIEQKLGYEERAAGAIRDLHNIHAQESEELAGVYGDRQRKQEELFKQLEDDRAKDREQLAKRQAALDEAAARHSQDLADRGKFWRNPFNVLSALLTSMLPLAGVDPAKTMQMVNGAVEHDWRQRKELADQEMGALKSNLEAYRQIMGDRQAGDLMALGQSYKMAAMQAEQIAAKLGGAKARAAGEATFNGLMSKYKDITMAALEKAYMAPARRPVEQTDLLRRTGAIDLARDQVPGVLTGNTPGGPPGSGQMPGPGASPVAATQAPPIDSAGVAGEVAGGLAGAAGAGIGGVAAPADFASRLQAAAQAQVNQSQAGVTQSQAVDRVRPANITMPETTHTADLPSWVKRMPEGPARTAMVSARDKVEQMASIEAASDLASKKIDPSDPSYAARHRALTLEKTVKRIGDAEKAADAARPLLEASMDALHANSVAGNALNRLMAELRNPKTGAVDEQVLDEVLRGSTGSASLVLPGGAMRIIRDIHVNSGNPAKDEAAAIERVQKLRATLAMAVMASKKAVMGVAQGAGELADMARAVTLDDGIRKLRPYFELSTDAANAKFRSAMPSDTYAATKLRIQLGTNAPRSKIAQ